ITDEDYYNWEPDILGQGILGPCHNIYIDDDGYGYLVGCNLNNGGAMYIDLFTDPGSPAFIAMGPNVYSHDIYVRDNIMYSSEIYEGIFTIYDVTDKNNTLILASQPTPFDFTHNTWLSDDGNTIFTTDEVGDAPVASYDISDLGDIKELDQFRPLFTINQGVLPHNVFVWEDWLIISYYTDGCIIADGSRPDNIIEVGNFDTVLPGEGSGAWGVYPFLPSGTVLVTDINNGLYILEPNYVRACWLEGIVTDALSGALLNDVLVEISSSQTNFANSDLSGVYKTGQATAGTFDVTFSLAGYFPKTVSAILENGEVTLLDVELDPLPNASFSGQVVDAESGAPIPNAIVQINGDNLNYNTVADANGNFALATVVLGEYQILAGSWGYQTKLNPIEHISNTNTLVELDPGYADEFILDLGWEEVSSADGGLWERGVPIGTDFFGGIGNPDKDVIGDLGTMCYVTGNGGGNVWDDDVDDGFTRLISPVMDLSNIAQPIMKFSYWFTNFPVGGGGGTPNDFLEVRVSNGSTEAVVAIFSESNSEWLDYEVNLADFISITENMRVIFEAEDVPTGHVTEAGVDDFKIEGGDFLAPFTASVTTGCIPLEVTFTDPNSITNGWNWTFEGAMPANSTAQNPTVTYFSPGTYDVSLLAMTPNGEITLNEQNLINIQDVPSASFTYSISNDNVVEFDLSATNATDYTWSFGDGNSSALPNPIHTYTSSGTYEVELLVSNACGSSLITETIVIDLSTSTNELEFVVDLNTQPNPFDEAILISYQIDRSYQTGNLSIYNALGQQVTQLKIGNSSGQILTGDDLSSGLYFLQLQLDGKNVMSRKIIKE
ncbi:MAG: choice-of-anchor B family protein, partial [Bacteroidota bacterium]